MTKGFGVSQLWGVALLAFIALPSCGKSRSGGGDTIGSSGHAGEAAMDEGDEPSASGSVRAAPLAEGSFAVTASVFVSSDDPEPQLGGLGCGSFDFTARFEDDPEAGWLLVAAVSGEQRGTGLEPVDTDYRAVAVGPPSKEAFRGEGAVLDLPMGECCERLFIRALELSPETDSRGSWVGFSASGLGEVDTYDCGGDIYGTADVSVSLRGGPDLLAPRVIFPQGVLHPFDGIELPFSEVVRGETQASFIDESGVELPLERRGFLRPDGPFWGFRSGPLMSFGRSAAFEIDGTDWAGNPFTDRGSVASARDPGELAPDGFESSVTGLVEGNLKIVTHGAIAGERSLEIGAEAGSNSRVTFHLRSAEPAKLVRFSAQSLGWFDAAYDVAGVFVQVAAAGGSEIVTRDLPLDFAPTGGQAPEFPPARLVELELPELTRDAIVSFDLAPHTEECGLIHCVDVPALIDELRLE